MADRDNMSVEEMLAACRKADGGDAAAPAQPKAAAAEPTQDSPQPAASEAASRPAAEKSPGAMSVAEMLAAARLSDGSGSAPAKKENAAAESKPAPAPASGKSPGSMSVADMLAAARSEKSAGSTGAKEKPAAKAKPKADAAKAPAKSPAAKQEKVSTGPKDTQSILAAARKTDKSGPMSKSEAAARREKEKGEQDKPVKEKPVAPPMPEKPAYARPSPPQPRPVDDQETRRGFFGVFLGSYLAVGFTSLGLVNLLWVLGFARFMFPNILTEPPTKFKVGPPSNFAPGSVETKFKAQFGVWIVNTLFNGAQIIFALKTVCTHLGCTPNWLEAEQKFKCPCHGSGFYKDGINFEGPAPRPLERYAISKAADGQLEVDKSKTFQEEKGQWSDGTSYVQV